MNRRDFMKLVAGILVAKEVVPSPKPTPPSRISLGLLDETGKELSGNGYARAPFVTDGQAITFPTATGDWPETQTMVLFDGDGHRLMWFDLPTRVALRPGDTARAHVDLSPLFREALC